MVLNWVAANSTVVAPGHTPVARVHATEQVESRAVSPSPATCPLVNAFAGVAATQSFIPATVASDPVFDTLT